MTKIKMNCKGPIRRCVGCCKMFPKKDLFRVGKSQYEFYFSTKRNICGRGAYLCKSKVCLALAKKHRAFEQAFKSKNACAIYKILENELMNLEEKNIE